MATVEEQLLTIEEYSKMPDDGRRTELVQGRIIELPFVTFLQGVTCGHPIGELGLYSQERNLGQFVSGHSGVITQRNPDTLRGPDFSYYSYARIPKGFIPDPYPSVAAELIIEVLSPGESWSEIQSKVAEFLAIHVIVVCVIDPETRTARVYSQDRPDRMIGPDGDLTFPECLSGFSVPMQSLFE